MKNCKVYKVQFQVEFDCGGVINYGFGHTSVVSESEEEARNKFKSLLRIGGAGWDELSTAVKIIGINPIMEFNK